jgi:branched-chain amino acid transport system substrate-binding protein
MVDDMVRAERLDNLKLRNFMGKNMAQYNYRALFTGLLMAIVFLSACQTDDKQASSGTKITSVKVFRVQAEPKETVSVQTDIVGDLITSVETQQTESLEEATGNSGPKITIRPNEEVSLIQKQIQPSLPMPKISPALDETSSVLAQQALDAALDLLRSKPNSVISKTTAVQDLPPAVRNDGVVRVGLMLPLSGDYAELGLDIAGGIEMALFQTGEPDIELIYLDTKGETSAYQAALDAQSKAVDIIIGPLFTASIEQSAEILAQAGIPVLSMSNNQDAAQTGRWVMNYLPEQQMDNLLGYLVQENKMRIGILASEDVFGSRIMMHAISRLQELAISPAALSILPPDVLADEPTLKSRIKEFSRYVAPEEGVTDLPPPPYDAVILAGNADFVLRAAPVLAYYDLGPSQVTFVGTDLWTRSDLLREPSLQGSLIARAQIPEATIFETSWKETFKTGSSPLSRLGFDSMALITVTKRAHAAKTSDDNSLDVDWKGGLIQEQGFAGFSGTFRLLPDGRNSRSYDIHLLRDGQLLKM